MRRALTAVALLAWAAPSVAQVDVHGFVEGAWGVRTAQSSVHDGSSDYTLEEVRVQLLGTAYGDVGSATFRLDFVHDQVGEAENELEIREGFLRFSTFWDHLDVKAGRQAITWGTGDLIFVNDLFPKDWESLFIGREAQYLKWPSDAIRLGLFGLPFDVDFVLTPRFTPDNIPGPGARFSVTAPDEVSAPVLPPNTLGEGEMALRLSKYVADFDVNLYFNRGFYKVPRGFRLDPADSSIVPFYPELSVYGASARGGLVGGVAWLEGGYYDSRQNRDGTQMGIVPSSFRVLAGYERQMLSPTLTIQYFGDYLRHDSEQRARNSHLLTARLEQMLRYDTVRLSLFTYWWPEDGDAYVRAFVRYSVSDDASIVAGVNWFYRGSGEPTLISDLNEDDNVYLRLRYSF